MDPRKLATVVLLALSLLCPASIHARSVNSPVARGEASVAAPTVIAAPRAPLRGSKADERRYAERERGSRNARRFRAGDAIVITATAAIILLLGIIIILLVT